MYFCKQQIIVYTILSNSSFIYVIIMSIKKVQNFKIVKYRFVSQKCCAVNCNDFNTLDM